MSDMVSTQSDIIDQADEDKQILLKQLEALQMENDELKAYVAKQEEMEELTEQVLESVSNELTKQQNQNQKLQQEQDEQHSTTQTKLNDIETCNKLTTDNNVEIETHLKRSNSLLLSEINDCWVENNRLCELLNDAKVQQEYILNLKEQEEEEHSEEMKFILDEYNQFKMSSFNNTQLLSNKCQEYESILLAQSSQQKSQMDMIREFRARHKLLIGQVTFERNMRLRPSSQNKEQAMLK